MNIFNYFYSISLTINLFYIFCQIKTKEGEICNMKFAIAIVAAGAFSGQVVANVKAVDKLEQISLPVEPR